MTMQSDAALEAAHAQIELLNRCVVETNNAIAYVEQLFQQQQFVEFWHWAENVEAIVPTFFNALEALWAAADSYVAAGGGGAGLHGAYPYPDIGWAYPRLDSVLRQANASYAFVTQYQRTGGGRIRLQRATFHQIPSGRDRFNTAIARLGGTPG